MERQQEEQPALGPRRFDPRQDPFPAAKRRGEGDRPIGVAGVHGGGGVSCLDKISAVPLMPCAFFCCKLRNRPRWLAPDIYPKGLRCTTAHLRFFRVIRGNGNLLIPPSTTQRYCTRTGWIDPPPGASANMSVHIRGCTLEPAMYLSATRSRSWYLRRF